MEDHTQGLVLSRQVIYLWAVVLGEEKILVVHYILNLITYLLCVWGTSHAGAGETIWMVIIKDWLFR